MSEKDTNKASQQELEALRQRLQALTAYAVSAENPNPTAIDDIISSVQQLIDREARKARHSERAWAYKNMRDHGADPEWVEVAKTRYERAKSQEKSDEIN